MSCAAVVLAAGQALRFGGQKLLAPFGGRPILQHVLDVADECGLRPVVVVLGRYAEAVEAGLTWREELRVINGRPERGLSSSLRLGMSMLAAGAATRAVILLGDQPALSADQLRLLLREPPDAERPILVSRYGGRPGNPVLIERAGWPLVERLHGDRGLSQLFRHRPGLVRYLDLPGDNPDVDTPADLDAIAERGRLSRGAARDRSCRTADADRNRP